MSNVKVDVPGGSSSEQGEGVKECWICRDEENEEELISPCACQGTLQGVHLTCLTRWVETRLEDDVEEHGGVVADADSQRRCISCEICHTQYALERVEVFTWQCKLLCSVESWRSYFEFVTTLLMTIMCFWTVVIFLKTSDRPIWDKIFWGVMFGLCGLMTITTLHKVYTRWRASNSLISYAVSDRALAPVDPDPPLSPEAAESAPLLDPATSESAPLLDPTADEQARAGDMV